MTKPNFSFDVFDVPPPVKDKLIDLRKSEQKVSMKLNG